MFLSKKITHLLCLQMIRLTQPELVHDKKQQDSPTLDGNTNSIKKEVDTELVTSQGADQVSPGAYSSILASSFMSPKKADF